MALEKYRQKRDFRITPEPEGKVGKRRSRALTFVIQKHAATRLHTANVPSPSEMLAGWVVGINPSMRAR